MTTDLPVEQIGTDLILDDLIVVTRFRARFARSSVRSRELPRGGTHAATSARIPPAQISPEMTEAKPALTTPRMTNVMYGCERKQ